MECKRKQTALDPKHRKQLRKETTLACLLHCHESTRKKGNMGYLSTALGFKRTWKFPQGGLDVRWNEPKKLRSRNFCLDKSETCNCDPTERSVSGDGEPMTLGFNLLDSKMETSLTARDLNRNSSSEQAIPSVFFFARSLSFQFSLHFLHSSHASRHPF